MHRWNRRRFVQGAGLAGLTLLAACGRLPWQAPAPTRIPRVGYLAFGVRSSLDEAFRRGLQDLGYVEGQNIVIVYRAAQGASNQELREEAAQLAAELVNLPVDVIAAALAGPVGIARAATSTIPIVMLTSGDPVRDGFVESYGRPGGNVTGLGLLSTELAAKRLELLKELLPGLSRAAALLDPVFATDYEYEATLAAARQLGIDLRPLMVDDPSELDSAFGALVDQRIEGLIVFAHVFSGSYSRQIAAAAARHQLPAMYGRRPEVANGGLIGYGPSYPLAFYRAATYVDKIIKGAKPADLPVELPREFELVINLKTARALGLAIPQHILLQATEVIE